MLHRTLSLLAEYHSASDPDTSFGGSYGVVAVVMVVVLAVVFAVLLLVMGWVNGDSWEAVRRRRDREYERMLAESKMAKGFPVLPPPPKQ